MNWKESLDRYITAPPDNDFTEYCEEVTEAFTNTFVKANKNWIFYNTEQIKWLNSLYSRDVEPKKAAKIIERAFKFYCL